jgi:hypothetical protein
MEGESGLRRGFSPGGRTFSIRDRTQGETWRPEDKTEPEARPGLGAGHSLEGDPVLQPHFLVRQHSAILIQDQGLLQSQAGSKSPSPHPKSSLGAFENHLHFLLWPPVGLPKDQKEGSWVVDG